MAETEYAMYKGDHFVDLGTVPYLANKYHKTEDHLKFLTYPSAHKRRRGNNLLLYKIDERED